MSGQPGTPEARRRKLHALVDEIGLSRDERIEISKALLWRDVTSWKGLTEGQVNRMLDAVEGYMLIRETFRQRVNRTE